ncbi:MAG: saccharopine dehydrogenase C-terminal domain-containing protein [bacterium]
MTTIAVCGAGRMAEALVYDLQKFTKPGKIILVDNDQNRLAKFSGENLVKRHGDLSNPDFVRPFFEAADLACGAASYKLNLQLSELAIAAGCHFVDMGGNNAAVERQFSLSDKAEAAGVTIIPDCGLAPGMASILVAAAVSKLDEVESVKIRVGGLPQKPQPPLNYALFFSPEGLLNEYREAAVMIRDGKIVKRPSLEDVETLAFPPNFPKLEAFNTSGGTSTLPQTFAGKIENLAYKTIRYPGHCEQMRLLFDLGLATESALQVDGLEVAPARVLERLLAEKLPVSDQDVVLVRVEAVGKKNGQTRRLTYEIEDYFNPETGHTAMQRTTAYSVAIIMQMIAEGNIRERGTLRLEAGIDPVRFIALLAERGIDLRISE